MRSREDILNESVGLAPGDKRILEVLLDVRELLQTGIPEEAGQVLRVVCLTHQRGECPHGMKKRVTVKAFTEVCQKCELSEGV